MISLKNVLLINAVSSGATGVGLIFFSRFVAGLFGVTAPQPFWTVGIFLVCFAAFVFLESRQEVVREARVRLIVIMDVLWVVGSVVIAVFHLFNLSSLGYIFIIGVGAWVAVMAYMQTVGLRKIISKI